MGEISEAALILDNVGKSYNLYTHAHHRLWQTLCMGRKTFYREFAALQGVSLEVAKGECLGIIGRNGAGKSTLLSLLAGTVEPTSGVITVNGRRAALLELGSGFNPEFTGRENVWMNAAMLGLNQAEIKDIFPEIVAFADIGDFLDQPVKTYSSGMQLRLAFAVMAHVKADILIIDEALAVGDAYFTQKCMRFMRQFLAEHTVILVSHDTGAVVNLCQRVLVLKNGRMDYLGEPKKAVARYLADLYNEPEKEQDETLAVDGASSELVISDDYVDQRREWINNSNLRNDLVMPTFVSGLTQGFGNGDAVIKNVRFMDNFGRSLHTVVGGEEVILEITTIWRRVLFSPNVGFLVRDRLGQDLFGDNTCLDSLREPLTLTHDDQETVCRFVFRMPILPKGEYSLCVAATAGNQYEHTVCEWLTEALIFQSVSASVCTGLVGVPMKKIEFRTEE